MKKFYSILTGALLILLCSNAGAQSESVAKEWNEQVLFAISADFARPTVHARNLFHTSIAMYDAWMAYEPGGNTYLIGKTIGPFTSDFSGVPSIDDVEAAREEAMSFAVFRLIEHRYAQSPGVVVITDSIETLMESLNYDPSITSTNYTDGGAAELGNYIASQIIEFGYLDGANEANDYTNIYYEPLNPPIEVEEPGNPDIIDPNRWQQISLSESVDQSGEIVANTPDFLSPEWGDLIPFSMTDEDKEVKTRDGHDYNVYMDPGDPAYIDTTQASGLESFYKWNFMLVPMWQAHLDVNDEIEWDISPASIGNVQEYPETIEEYHNFYDFYEGGDPGTGYDLNPLTGEPYEPLLIKRADYGRVLAEFWADGPNSVTPPGHWFDIYNQISEHPLFERKWEGVGPELDALEYDVKAYLAIGGAMHDAAIAAWSIKGYYDYLRPVSAVRYMADRGQSTDPDLPNYHPAGVPLITDYVELVEPGDPLAGDNNEHLKKIKLYTWRGPDYIDDPETDVAGVGWILAENWWPYQRPSFVTPPFAGYVSGHSTYSRTAAELLTLMTGSPYFPGGMSGFQVEENEFLVFEEGPSQSFELQWATYRDASDQCSLSRIWGGIHPPVDDIPGRFIGMELGPKCFIHADSIIEKVNPHVTEWSSDLTDMNESSIGNELTFVVTYDRVMDQSISPVLNFVHPEVAAALSEISGVWISSTQFEFSFSLEPVIVEGFSTSCFIVGAEALDGSVQNPYLLAEPIDLDTKKPELVETLASDSLLNDEVIQNSEFSVILSFNELCDTEQNPSIQLVADGDIGNTLILNNTASDWIDGQTYSAIFDLTDENIQNQNLSLSISACMDLLGNEMAETLIDDIVLIDSKNPEILTITVEDDILNIQDYGMADLIVTIDFDEDMNTEEIPQLVFLGEDPLGTSLNFNEFNSLWSSRTTCQIHYDFELAEAEFIDVAVSLTEFRDEFGNAMQNPTVPDLFTIDTKRPTVEMVTPEVQTISDQNVLSGEFYLDIAFSEPMNTDQNALILLSAQGIESSLSVDFTNSTWLDENNFRASFNVEDQNIEIDDIDISVDFALDAQNNTQVAEELTAVFDLDTRNPELISLSSSNYSIDPESIGTESFHFIMIFDEAMQNNSEVQVSFTPNDPVTSILLENESASEWLNNLTYKMVFDVNQSDEVVPSVDAEVLNGKDEAGNNMIVFDFENLLSIDLDILSVESLENQGDIRIYPTILNQGQRLNIHYSGKPETAFLTIRDLQGRPVGQENLGVLSPGKSSIDIPEVSTGFYLFQLTYGDEFYSNKILVR